MRCRSTDDVSSGAMVEGFQRIPGLLDVVYDERARARAAIASVVAAACELVLEALVARKKISRSDTGQYGRAQPPERRRPNQDLFGGGMMA